MTSDESEKTTALIAAAVVCTLTISGFVSMRDVPEPVEEEVESTPADVVGFDLDTPGSVFVFVGDYGPPRKLQHARTLADVPRSRRHVIRVRSRDLPHDAIYVLEDVSRNKAEARLVSLDTYTSLVAAQEAGFRASTMVYNSTQAVEERIKPFDDTERSFERGKIFENPAPPQQPGQFPGSGMPQMVEGQQADAAEIALATGDWRAAQAICETSSGPKCDSIRKRASQLSQE